MAIQFRLPMIIITDYVCRAPPLDLARQYERLLALPARQPRFVLGQSIGMSGLDFGKDDRNPFIIWSREESNSAI